LLIREPVAEPVAMMIFETVEEVIVLIYKKN